LIAVGLGVLTLAGCIGADGEIFNDFKVEKGESVTLDAQQRALLNIPVDYGADGRRRQPPRIICAEPSPDTAVAIARAVTLAARADVSAPRVTVGTGVQFTDSLSQSLIQLGERTATIQLLRDTLFRACEGYANGALDKMTYAFIISRIDTLMSTLALGELSAGAFGRELAAVSSLAGIGGLAAQGDKLVAGAAAELARRKEIEAEKKKVVDGLAADAAEDAKSKARQEYELAKAAVREAEGQAATTKALSEATAMAGAATAGGAIAQSRTPASAEIGMLQKRYFDHVRDDDGPLLAACMVSLNDQSKPAQPAGSGGTAPQAGAASAESDLVRYCGRLLEQTMGSAGQRIGAAIDQKATQLALLRRYADACVGRNLNKQQQQNCDRLAQSLP